MGSRPQPIQKDEFSNVSAFLKASAYCLVKLLFLRIVIMAMINLPDIYSKSIIKTLEKDVKYVQS